MCTVTGQIEPPRGRVIQEEEEEEEEEDEAFWRNCCRR